MSDLIGDHFTPFTPKAFTFLRGIAKHNRKEWFEEHRADFEREIKQPLAQLVEEVEEMEKQEPQVLVVLVLLMEEEEEEHIDPFLPVLV